MYKVGTKEFADFDQVIKFAENELGLEFTPPSDMTEEMREEACKELELIKAEQDSINETLDSLTAYQNDHGN